MKQYYTTRDSLNVNLKLKSEQQLKLNFKEHNTIIRYNTVQYNTIQYNTIQYSTIQYNTIQYNITQSNQMIHNPIQSNPIQSNPIQSNPIQSNPILFNTIRYNMVWYSSHKVIYLLAFSSSIISAASLYVTRPQFSIAPWGKYINIDNCNFNNLISRIFFLIKMLTTLFSNFFQNKNILLST